MGRRRSQQFARQVVLLQAALLTLALCGLGTATAAKQGMSVRSLTQRMSSMFRSKFNLSRVVGPVSLKVVPLVKVSVKSASAHFGMNAQTMQWLSGVPQHLGKKLGTLKASANAYKGMLLSADTIKTSWATLSPGGIKTTVAYALAKRELNYFVDAVKDIAARYQVGAFNPDALKEAVYALMQKNGAYPGLLAILLQSVGNNATQLAIAKRKKILVTAFQKNRIAHEALEIFFEHLKKPLESLEYAEVEAE